jgi:hypothetical protein
MDIAFGAARRDEGAGRENGAITKLLCSLWSIIGIRMAAVRI